MKPRRSAPALLISLAALVLAAAGTTVRGGDADPGTWPTTAGQAAQHDIDGQVDVGGGRQMHVRCRGTGSPTVVLISGKGTGADDWMQILAPGDPAQTAPGDDLSWGHGELMHSDEAVFPQVARSTRVCTYDRPDVRFDGEVTTPRSQPHTSDLDVADLVSLFAAIGENEPKVLVAHSYGGLIATLYARTHPTDVAGLVMVDTASELMAGVATPAALSNWDRANAATSPQVQEGVQLLDAFARIDAAPAMPELPAVVLAADKPWRVDLLPPEVAQEESVTFADWLAMLDRLASDLDAGIITKTRSGHHIYLYNPTIVIDAIELVVDDVRALDGPVLDAAATNRLETAFEAGFAESGADGATVGVSVPGERSFVRSMGISDRATGAPMAPKMQAPIGSVTKTYTVLVALQLVGEGRLSLDDTIEQWYPRYPDASEINIRMLMNHSSGVGDISEVQIETKCADAEAVLSPDELIEISAGTPRAPFNPGDGSSYSSANTIILGRILEQVTGSSYEQLLTERLFDPLGLARTRLDDDGVLEAPSTRGYTDFCAPDRPKGLDTSSWPLLPFSAGALASTVDDRLRYGTAFGEGYGLTDELRRARTDETAPPDDTSGLGLVIQRDPDSGEIVSLGHAGSEMGFGANLVYYPCTGTVFVAILNADFSPAMIDILTEVQPIVEELATAPCSTTR